jgi:hypothetical protein
MSQKRIEDLFKSGMQEGEAAYQPGDWEKMSQLLDEDAQQPKPSMVYKRRWLLLLLLLLFITATVVLFTRKEGLEPKPALNSANKASDGAIPPSVASGEGNQSFSPNVNHSLPQNNTNDTLHQRGSNNSVSHASDPVTMPTRLPTQTAGNDDHVSGGSVNPVNRLQIQTFNTNNNPARKQYHPSKKQDQGVGIVQGAKDRTKSNLPSKAKPVVADDQVVITDKNPGAGQPRQSPAGTTIINIPIADSGVTAKNSHQQDVKVNMTATIPASDSSKMLGDTGSKKKASKAGKEPTTKNLLRKILGFPQWASVSFVMAPTASNSYNIVGDPLFQEPYSFSSNDSNGRATMGVQVAIGSQWFPRSDKWSLNSYLMLQYIPASHIAKSSSITYGTGFLSLDTIIETKTLIAMRVGADWIHHSKKDKWQIGGGLNLSYIAAGRGTINYYTKSPSGGGSYLNNKTFGALNGIDRFNIGISGVVNYRISKSLMIDLRGSFDFSDITRNNYFRNRQRNNLSYFAAGLKFLFNND